ncbi:cadherin domain-containing protein, partial [Thalassotalea sp. G20_0]|uniref:Ig-like domain-containing protein n=1 Tax=Thalassotalea sp. G20_0 TaxID=2821093 RepID=UPI001AD9E83E|nr:cadherin domain-containing protein [Thalassotalea sp. G20_0]
MDTIQEATASKSAGSIHFAIGKVEAITPDGNRRLLQAGDVVYPNETVITGPDGFIHIDLFDGQVLELSNNDEFSFTAFYQDFLPDDAEIEIEAEQFELPDTPLPATGQPDGQGNSGFGSQTILDLSGIQVDPEAGFDTSGVQRGIEDSESFVADELLDIDENDAPIITSNGGGDKAVIEVLENSNTVTKVTAIDVDQSGRDLIFSIAGGADSSSFEIATDGTLSFITEPDFESGKISYDVEVQVSDGFRVDTQALTVNVAPQNDNSPIITSDGGGDRAIVEIAENSSFVTVVKAIDADKPDDDLSFRIAGGGDAAAFEITNDGSLSFKEAPDYESGKVVYEVEVEVSDGKGKIDTQLLTVNVVSVDEGVPAGVSDRITVAEGSTATALVGGATTVRANDTGLTDTPVTVSLVTNVQHGSLVLNENGTFSYAHDGSE